MKELTILFKNKVILYIGSRYITYFIQFINSLFIAVYLGPYYLGIWGFITLIIQYFNQLNFGISDSVNALISIRKDREWYIEKIVGTSLSMILFPSIIIIIFLIANKSLNINLGEKYTFAIYAPYVGLIGILGYFNALFNNIFRAYGRLFEIAFNQSFFPILMLITILFFKGKDLLFALVLTNLISSLISLIIFILRSPVKLKPIFIRRLALTIQTKGLNLFVFFTSIYMLIISTRSFISAFYTIEEFGYFTFANTLTSAAFLFLESLSFLIYPKLLNRLANSAHDQATKLLQSIREVYITTSHLLVHVAIFILPFFLLIFTQYKNTTIVFNLIALTIVLYTNSFGYTGLLVAKGKENVLAKIAVITLLLNIIVVVLLIKVAHVPYTHVILATLISYLTFSLLVSWFANRLLKNNTKILSLINDVFPARLLLPFTLNLYFSITEKESIYFGLSLIIFLILNKKSLFRIKDTTLKIFNNANIINI